MMIYDEGSSTREEVENGKQLTVKDIECSLSNKINTVQYSVHQETKAGQLNITTIEVVKQVKQKI